MHILYGLDIIQIRVSLNLFPRVRLTQSSIGSGNGLAPNRRQAIAWTNDNQVLWRIYAALGGKANPGYSIPDENLVDMNMYVFVCTHFTHATQINIFGKYITIKQQWNLTQATGHVVVATNTGTTAAVPHPSATRIGHPQIPTNPWFPTPERAIEAWPRPNGTGAAAPGRTASRHAPPVCNKVNTLCYERRWY